MKRITNQSFIAICFLLGILQSCSDTTNSGFSDQFVSPEKNKIVVTIANNAIRLKADGLGGFSECKPYFAWRIEGEGKWTEDEASSIENAKISETETKLICPVGPVDATIIIKKLDDNIYEFSGSIKNKSARIIEMARFHYLKGIVDDNKSNFISYTSFGIHKNTDNVPSSRTLNEKLWKHWGVDFPMLSNPIHDEENWSTSHDAGIFAPALNKLGWFMGYTGPGTAFGEIGFKTQVQPSQFYSGVLLDNVILEPDSVRILEKFIVYAGDWQTAMSYWVKLTAKEFNVKPQANPLVGYCSWYQKYQNVNAQDILQANEEFSKMPIPLGGRTIQIDDGFQVMPGNWGPNKRFEKEWKNIPKKITETGSIPGLWLAPTAICDIHPIAKSHHEMLQHLPNGDNAVIFSNWGWSVDAKGNKGNKTYFLEIDRPDSKAFIADIMKKAVGDGWRYFKVDFTYGISTARVAYNRKKTQFESLKDLYALLRQSTGPNILINACVGYAERYPLGNVDILRIGGDIGGNWNTVQSNLRELLSRANVNGIWYQADPDVFFMRKENTNLNDEENFLLTGSVALIGGIFLTSDLTSQWSPESRRIVDSLWTNQGPRIPERHFVAYDDNNSIKAYLVSYNDGKTPQHKVGIYNWSDNAETVTISLDELKLKSDLKWKATPFIHRQTVNLQNNAIVVENMPPHSMRIVDLDVE